MRIRRKDKKFNFQETDFDIRIVCLRSRQRSEIACNIGEMKDASEDRWFISVKMVLEAEGRWIPEKVVGRRAGWNFALEINGSKRKKREAMTCQVLQWTMAGKRNEYQVLYSCTTNQIHKWKPDRLWSLEGDCQWNNYGAWRQKNP